MTINKVLILGIDALEYELVQQWNLQNLMQNEYGTTQLPINKEDGYFYAEPNTLIMWTSFITGEPPKIHGLDTYRVYKFPLNLFVKYVLYKLLNIGEKTHIPHKDKRRKKDIRDRFSYIIKNLNLYRMPTLKDIKTSTIFDSNSRFIHCHIPVYDKDPFPSYKKRIVEAIENKAYKPLFEIQCSQEFYHRVNEVNKWLDKKNEWDIFMQYFYVLDGIQHAFFNNINKIAKYYLIFDEFIGKIKNKLNDNILLLIVSDHGQINGIHTNYGFYSANKSLGLHNPRLIDFRCIIEELLKK